MKKVAAHSRYYPGEWSGAHCRGILAKVWNDFKETEATRRKSEVPNTNEVRDEAHDLKQKLRAAFDLIYQRNSPVFRFFFIENFVQPETWYLAKMRYIRSVAVSSIVGHILGIGALNWGGGSGDVSCRCANFCFASLLW